MTCAQGLLRLLWGGPEVGVLRDWPKCKRKDVSSLLNCARIMKIDFTRESFLKFVLFVTMCAMCLIIIL